MPRQHLGEFEQLLLYALLRLGDAAHSGAIRDDVYERTGRALSPGAVYTGLDRLCAFADDPRARLRAASQAASG